MKQKKLLILAGAAVHCKLVRAAREMGVYTIVTDYCSDSPAKELADEQWSLDIFDVDGIVARCQKEHVDGVISVCIDPAQKPYQEICQRLSLPCYGTAEQFRIMTDKAEFKKFCNEHGVDIIPTYSTEDMLSGRADFPVLVKPVDSRGSRGQTVCYDKTQLEQAMAFAASESRNGGIIIEKYMGGKQDFSMTYFVINNIPYLVRTADRYLGKMEDGLDKQSICSVSPSKHSDMYIQNVHPKFVKMIRTLGVRNGPLFVQGFIDGDTVRMYDPGLRFPGAEYETLFCKATGADMMKMMVEFALSGKITDQFGALENGYQLGGKRSVQLLITARAGTIATFDGLEEIRRNPHTVAVSPRYKVGDAVPNSGNVKQRVCEIVLLVDEEDSMEESIHWVQSKLRVCDSFGCDMLVSQIDTQIL